MEPQLWINDPVLSLSNEVVETYSKKIGIPLKKCSIVYRDDKKIEARLKNKKDVWFQYNATSTQDKLWLEQIKNVHQVQAKINRPSINERRIAHNLFIKFHWAIQALANKIDGNWNDWYCFKVWINDDDLDIYLLTKDGSRAIELRWPPTEPEPTIKIRRLKDKLTYEL